MKWLTIFTYHSRSYELTQTIYCTEQYYNAAHVQNDTNYCQCTRATLYLHHSHQNSCWCRNNGVVCYLAQNIHTHWNNFVAPSKCHSKERIWAVLFQTSLSIVKLLHWRPALSQHCHFHTRTLLPNNTKQKENKASLYKSEIKFFSYSWIEFRKLYSSLVSCTE